MEKKTVFIALAISLFFLIVGYYLTNDISDEENHQKSYLPDTTEQDKKTYYARNKQIHLAIEKTAWLEKEIRKLVLENLDNINSSNCQGLLEDKDDNDIYENDIFGRHFKFNREVLFHYNFCSFVWNKGGGIIIISTTKSLMSDQFSQTDKFGNIFVPAYVYKKTTDARVKDDVIDENVGLIDITTFIQGMAK